MASSTKPQSWHHEGFLCKPTMRSHRALGVVLSSILANSQRIINQFSLLAHQNQWRKDRSADSTLSFPCKNILFSMRKEERKSMLAQTLPFTHYMEMSCKYQCFTFSTNIIISGNVIVTYPPAQFSVYSLSLSSKRQWQFASCMMSGVQLLITRQRTVWYADAQTETAAPQVLYLSVYSQT